MAVTREKAKKSVALKTFCTYSYNEIIGHEILFDLMVGMFYHQKNSGKFKRQLSDTATALDVKAFRHPKVHGTRFINHIRNGLNALLKNWLHLILTLENAIATPGSKSAKLKGYLKKLKNGKILGVAVLMKSIIDVAAQASLKLERRQLFIFDVACIMDICLTNLESCDGSLATQNFTLNGNNLTLCSKPSAVVCINGCTFSESQLNSLKERTIQSMKDISLGIVLSKSSMIHFTTNWTKTHEEIGAMEKLAAHFSRPLEKTAFDKHRLKAEWNAMKTTYKHYGQGQVAGAFWSRTLQHRHNHFPQTTQLPQCMPPGGAGHGPRAKQQRGRVPLVS
ncbi:hypothetical protein CAPTEDRAFT_212304 [Capitella teleta]|uniref:Uncharacterized protein n=1 Tax=Capitella teleta TaxID=283909 RepID=R7UX63_CAPTE|nr:hypothetical protein CAPTEDRAFT_212304 [Capitella teleta]|eukprot:ELU10934.1 hypothetical protein CAPTEDRAFT_212304 [Capitella teleta]